MFIKLKLNSTTFLAIKIKFKLYTIKTKTCFGPPIVFVPERYLPQSLILLCYVTDVLYLYNFYMSIYDTK